ncbi:hypothetical protein PP939_gp026 [Rhizobium phage RL38J1]|uniref:Uncharacterized protein n=1 Tax=Rhizobium phage RL38J1 TaxID=2663232 RepID=A0A6B9J1M1_9CAUD|nr:hypothetical protein PP939_gp026 [Rhizobium phage RL38J1]QGZ14050.1 hypothetical protein RL38J1_026 [Rhizobium phage RL38J1]
MKNYYKGEGYGSETSIFTIAECTKEEAEDFCKRMNACMKFEEYYVEDDAYRCDADYLKSMADGVEEASRKRT